MPVPEKKSLVNVLMERQLIDRLDEYRFEHRFPSRAAAITWLLERALEQNPKPEKRQRQGIEEAVR